MKERKILEVHIDKGMKDGQKITFASEGDQEPAIAPGDIIIILDEKEHAVFKRDGLDLHMRLVCATLHNAFTDLKNPLIAIHFMDLQRYIPTCRPSTGHSSCGWSIMIGCQHYVLLGKPAKKLNFVLAIKYCATFIHW